MENRNRPIGVTILAAILMLIAFRMLSPLFLHPTELASERIANASVADFLGAACGLCAVVAAVALWEMKTWAVYAYAAWAVLHMAAFAVKDITLKVQEKTQHDWSYILIAPAIFAVVHGLICTALKKSLKPSA